MFLLKTAEDRRMGVALLQESRLSRHRHFIREPPRPLTSPTPSAHPCGRFLACASRLACDTSFVSIVFSASSILSKLSIAEYRPGFLCVLGVASSGCRLTWPRVANPWIWILGPKVAGVLRANRK
jgi:hypothetical protein